MFNLKQFFARGTLFRIMLLSILIFSGGSLFSQEATPLNLQPDIDLYYHFHQSEMIEDEKMQIKQGTSWGRQPFLSKTFEMTKNVDSAFVMLYGTEIDANATEFEIAGIDTLFDMAFAEPLPTEDKYTYCDTLSIDGSTEEMWFKWDVTEYIQYLVDNNIQDFSFRIRIVSGSNYMNFNSIQSADNKPIIALYQEGGPQNIAPSIVSPIEDISFDENTGPYTVVSDLSSVFTDPNQDDSLTFSVSANEVFAMPSVDGDSLVIDYADDAYGISEVYLTATDKMGESITDTINVVVNEVLDNEYILHPFMDGYITKSGGTSPINSESDNLVFKNSSDSWVRNVFLNFDMSSIASKVDSAYLKLYCYELTGSGTTELKLLGIDSTFNSDLTWNTIPATEKFQSGGDSIVISGTDVGEYHTWEVTDFLNAMKDVDADSFGIRISSDLTNGFYLKYKSMEASNKWLVPKLYVYSNGAPELISTIDDQVFDEDTGPHTIVEDLYTIFSDPEGQEMEFTVVSKNESIVLSINNDSLLVTSQKDYYGSGEVIVSAIDPVGATAKDTFNVTVNEVPEDNVVIGPAFDGYWHQKSATLFHDGPSIELRDTLDSGGWGRIAYFGFDFEMEKSVDSAFFQLYCSWVYFGDIDTTIIELAPIDNELFGTDLTIDNDPLEGEYATEYRDTIIFTPDDKGAWIKFDVTEYVNHLKDEGVSQYSFRISSITPAGEYLRFNSSENSANSPGISLYQPGGAQNLAPKLSAPIQDITFDEDTGPYTLVQNLNAHFTDPNKTIPSYTAITEQPEIHVIIEGDSLVVNSTEGFSGSGDVYVIATDPEGATATDTFQVKVNTILGGQYVLNPTMDGYVQGASQLKTESSELLYKNSADSWNRRIYMNMDISEIDTTIEKAYLKLYCFYTHYSEITSYFEAHGFSEPISKEATGLEIPDSAFVSAAESIVKNASDVNEWYVWDVTEYLKQLKSDGVKEFAIRIFSKDVNVQYAKFYSNESSQKWLAPKMEVFTVENAAPPAPGLVSPADGDTLHSFSSINFDWEDVTDPDDDPVNYTFHFWALNGDFDTTVTGLSESEFTFTGLENVADDSRFEWEVVVSDNVHDISSDVFSFSISTTGIKDENSNIPDVFSLSENYPNPFNPTTGIKYGLPKSSHVKIDVYNTLGQKVATIVDNNKRAGYHKVIFDAQGLSSGVYFYRIKSGDFIKVRKMMLLK